MKKICIFVVLATLAASVSAYASTPIFSCASKGASAEDGFRVNVFTSTNGSLKASLLGGQTTANTWVTYDLIEKTCDGGGGFCYSGESKKKLENSTFRLELQVTRKAAKNENRLGLAATVTAEAFDLRLPVGKQRLAFKNVSIVCAKKD